MIGDQKAGQIEYYDNKSFVKTLSNFHSNTITYLKYLTLNGYVASASLDLSVNIWDPITWSSIQIYKNLSSPVFGLDQIDADTIVSG